MVNVKGGFARNFLLPRGLAVYATPDNVKHFETERARIEERTRARRVQAERDRKILGEAALTFVENVMDGAAIFGSVTARKIAKRILLRGIEVKSEQIALAQPIRTFGSHRVSINLYADIVAEIDVHVVRSKADAEEFETMALHVRQDQALALLERMACKTNGAADETANLTEIAALTNDEIAAATERAVANKSLPELQSCVSRLLDVLNVNCLASFTCAPDESDAALLNAKMTVLGTLSVDVGDRATIRVADPSWLSRCEPRLSLFSLNARLAGPPKKYTLIAKDGSAEAVVVEQALRRTSEDPHAHTEVWATAYVNGACVQRGVWAVD